MMRTFILFKTEDSSGANSKLLVPPPPAPDRLFLSGLEHVIGWKLCCPVQAAGGRAAGPVAGLVAFCHRRPCYAALADKTCLGASHDWRDQKAGFCGVFSG